MNSSQKLTIVDETGPRRLVGLYCLKVFLCDLIGDPLANSIHQHANQQSSNSIAYDKQVVETLEPFL